MLKSECYLRPLILGEESKEPAPEVPKPAAKPARQISARLDNLSKPKRTSEIGLQNNAARQRSFSHEDAKVYRGRSVAKPQESWVNYFYWRFSHFDNPLINKN